MKEIKSWVKIDTSFFRHPKILQLTPAQIIALLQLYCHAYEVKNGGFLSTKEIQIYAKKRTKERLIETKLLDPTDDPDVYYLHDWTQHQAQQNPKSTAGSKGAHTTWHTKKGIIEPTCKWCKSDESAKVLPYGKCQG